MAKTKLKKCIMTGKLNRITDGANQELPRELPRGNILSKNIFTLSKKIKKTNTKLKNLVHVFSYLRKCRDHTQACCWVRRFFR